jgi:hypothetical protein
MSYGLQIVPYLAFAILAAPAATPGRKLVIDFQGQMCSTMHPNWQTFFECGPTRQRLLTLGTKVLWYESADKPKGTVFSLDKIVDLTADGDNPFNPVPADRLRVARESRTAFATWAGDVLQLQMLAEGYSKKNKRVYSYRHEFSVRVSQGRCEILNWYQGGFTGYKSNTLFFVLKDAAARSGVSEAGRLAVRLRPGRALAFTQSLLIPSPRFHARKSRLQLFPWGLAI